MDIIDRVTFNFDPQFKPEVGRVRFVFTKDYIQTLIDNGENLEVEFKGYKVSGLRPSSTPHTNT